jgi:hypothetical protein
MAGSMRAVLICLAAVAWAAPAPALVFDEVGEASFEPGSTWTQSFEPGELPVPPDAGDGGDEEEPLVVEGVETALHGSWVLVLDQFGGANLPVTLPSAEKSYRATAWARGEVVGTLEVEYTEGRIDQFGVLYPTGRMTSDGWYELEMRGLSIDATRAKRVQIGFFSPSGAEVDAIEIGADGPAVPERTCAGANDKSSCGAEEVCE